MVTLKKHNTSGIYQIKIREYCYIGSSKSIYYRVKEHLSKLRRNLHSNPILQNLFNKYREDSIEISILDFCSKEDLTKIEQKYIDNIKPYINITKEVIRNTPSLESRKKISDTLKRKVSTGEIKHSGTSKKSVCIYKDGKLIDICESIVSTANKYNLDFRKVSAICNNICGRKSHKGYTFRFEKAAPVKLGELLENPEEDNQQLS